MDYLSFDGGCSMNPVALSTNETISNLRGYPPHNRLRRKPRGLGPSRKEAAAKITDVDFATTVLEPCGIQIQNMGVNKNLNKTFPYPRTGSTIEPQEPPRNLPDKTRA
ncbi:hypothetical protein GJ744_009476 [Endocarpon pusillum]|uniref:Uncharacterized protein n=1 Tax=Endocarpon pusillum TaxID=364733 RepID=A0A8H7E2K3_9EURO|nr:hypothetical protein GJ744_009476 [Endocarpon pusillum]